MVEKGYTPEQIIGKLRKAETLLSQGASIAEASKKIMINGSKFDEEKDHLCLASLLNYDGDLRFGGVSY